MADEYQPLVVPPAQRKEPAIWFAFHRGELLVANGDGETRLPRGRDISDFGINSLRSLYLGTFGGEHCYVAELEHANELPHGHAMQGLRAIFGMVEEPLAVLAGRAFQIMEWDRNHQFCSRCGTPMVARTDERARACPKCRFTVYPPVSPAIMILIKRGREVLLGRKKEWAPGRYSALAGFVEPGEMLEDTVRRETREEVGVEVENIRYFGSQPWPFPHSLMVAFTADYAGGEIRPDGIEIEEARFFDAEQLPQLPPSISISRRLITTVCAKLARGEEV
ncbi:MAG: NAD(+) diphosphatase [Burkholderiales bacterium]